MWDLTSGAYSPNKKERVIPAKLGSHSSGYQNSNAGSKHERNDVNAGLFRGVSSALRAVNPDISRKVSSDLQLDRTREAGRYLPTLQA